MRRLFLFFIFLFNTEIIDLCLRREILNSEQSEKKYIGEKRNNNNFLMLVSNDDNRGFSCCCCSEIQK